VWTGSQMLVWGGILGATSLNTGGRYEPRYDTWSPTSLFRTPSPRSGHTAVWTGKEMLVFGGSPVSSAGSGPSSYTPSQTVFLYQKL
jgi:hypothetical protein